MGIGWNRITFEEALNVDDDAASHLFLASSITNVDELIEVAYYKKLPKLFVKILDTYPPNEKNFQKLLIRATRDHRENDCYHEMNSLINNYELHVDLSEYDEKDVMNFIDGRFIDTKDIFIPAYENKEDLIGTIKKRFPLWKPVKK